MPDFSPSGAFTRTIGQRSEITGVVYRTNETTNTIAVGLTLGLQSGQSQAENINADIEVTLTNASIGQPDYTYTWANMALASGAADATRYTAAQPVGGDIKQYRQAQVDVRPIL